jgi:hypothetical protein
MIIHLHKARTAGRSHHNDNRPDGVENGEIWKAGEWNKVSSGVAMVTPYKITPRKMTTIREVRWILFSSEAIRLKPPPFPRQPLRRQTESSFQNVFSWKISVAGRFAQKTRRSYTDRGWLVTLNLAVTYERGNLPTARYRRRISGIIQQTKTLAGVAQLAQRLSYGLHNQVIWGSIPGRDKSSLLHCVQYRL